MDYKEQLSNVIQHFWITREKQDRRQGTTTGRKDYGSRGSVTGGKQLDGFIKLFASILTENGLPEYAIHVKDTTLPGYFRPTKEWDLVAIADKQLIATIEFKSHVGPSFGNNFNNRVEEALGSATDIWTAYREGAFKPSSKPWLGYFMLLEKHPKSLSPVRTREPHFSVFPEFHEFSYKDRYNKFCERLVRERLYDSSCLILSDRESGKDGYFEEPSEELNFTNFISSLSGRVISVVKKIKIDKSLF